MRKSRNHSAPTANRRVSAYAPKLTYVCMYIAAVACQMQNMYLCIYVCRYAHFQACMYICMCALLLLSFKATHVAGVWFLAGNAIFC